jgi:hypothetical protein
MIPEKNTNWNWRVLFHRQTRPTLHKSGTSGSLIGKARSVETAYYGEASIEKWICKRAFRGQLWNWAKVLGATQTQRVSLALSG